MHAMHDLVVLTMRMAADGSPRTLGTAASVCSCGGYMAVSEGVGDVDGEGVEARGAGSACMPCML